MPLAITACALLFVITAAGCGGEEPEGFQIARAVAPEETSVPIYIDGEECVGDPASRSRVDRVEVEETAEAVVIRPYLDHGDEPTTCLGVGLIHHAIAKLNTPLGERAVLSDGRDQVRMPAPPSLKEFRETLGRGCNAVRKAFFSSRPGFAESERRRGTDRTVTEFRRLGVPTAKAAEARALLWSVRQDLLTAADQRHRRAFSDRTARRATALGIGECG